MRTCLQHVRNVSPTHLCHHLNFSVAVGATEASMPSTDAQSLLEEHDVRQPAPVPQQDEMSESEREVVNGAQ